MTIFFYNVSHNIGASHFCYREWPFFIAFERLVKGEIWGAIFISTVQRGQLVANTILSNKELHEYISQHSTSKSSKARKAPRMPQEELSNIFKQVKEDRNIERVRRRYMKLSKSELVELLIRSEQYIAQNNKLWLKKEFERHQ